MAEKILSRRFGNSPCNIKDYIADGGYGALKKALSMKPVDVIEEVKKSGLRGRGGAGFPTGLKWSFVPKDINPKYLICNADESEPGTCKDGVLMENDPHLVIEGIAIASYAIGVNTAFIYIRGEFAHIYPILERAIEEAKSEGILGSRVMGSKDFSLDILVTRGAGAYICGEETSQIESLEGKRGYPRIKPPFPAVEGFLGKPTVVNNVETLSNVPFIIEKGAEAYRKIGTEKSPGTRLFSLSGHVEKPGVYELPHGYPLKKLIEEQGGGVWNGRSLKAVIPGGSSVPVLRAEECDINLDFESVAAAGSMLGSAAVIVMDDTTDMVDAIVNLARFYAHESCGQCTPCREGVPWMLKILRRIAEGGGRPSDCDLLVDICNRIMGKTVCPLGDAAAMPVKSFVTKFRDEFLAKMK